jgi:hypothetical protein
VAEHKQSNLNCRHADSGILFDVGEQPNIVIIVMAMSIAMSMAMAISSKKQMR